MPQKSARNIQVCFRAGAAMRSAIETGLAGYDRRRALARFHRLSGEILAADTVEAGRRVVAEVERALRMERARVGHWSYDLDRHIALLITLRAEKARLSRL